MVHMVVVTFSVRPYRLRTRNCGNNRPACSTKLPGIGAPDEPHSRILPMSCTAGS